MTSKKVSPRVQGRYLIRRKPGKAGARDPKPFVIYDRVLRGYCTLSDGSNLLPLEWRSYEGAQAWLFQCRTAWLAGIVPTPKGAGAMVRTVYRREGGVIVSEEAWQ